MFDKANNFPEDFGLFVDVPMAMGINSGVPAHLSTESSGAKFLTVIRRIAIKWV